MKFTLAQIFSEHMILQRGLQVPIFGTAPDGAKVTVSLGGHTASAQAQGGRWLAILPEMDMRGPQTLTACCGEERLMVQDVLLGEVWLAGGQSNMEFELEKAAGGPADIAAADDDELRYYQVVKAASENDRAKAEAEAPACWMSASPETAGQFSAVAYHFAKRMRQSEGVPVGLIGCNWGGTSASCWMSRETLLSDPELAVYLDDYENAVKGFSAGEYAKQKAEYASRIDAYQDAVARIPVPKEDEEAYRAARLRIEYPWPPPMGPECFLRPNGLYETMLSHVAPYGLRGVIWYQGETDEVHPTLYARLFSKVIEQWRRDFLRPELFFAFVQLTSYASDDADSPRWGVLRRQQAQVEREVAHTAMAVVYDVGEHDNIHPAEKRTVGHRLADQVLCKVYGRDLDVRLARPVRRWTQGNALVLDFDLPLSVRGERARGFQVCGGDGVYRWAQAQVAGSIVTLTCSEIAAPVAARYAMTNWTEGNVYQANGIPLPPFATDEE